MATRILGAVPSPLLRSSMRNQSISDSALIPGTFYVEKTVDSDRLIAGLDHDFVDGNMFWLLERIDDGTSNVLGIQNLRS
jgi:hypothetical protein